MSIDYMQHRKAFICSIYKYIYLLAINSNLETTVTHNAFPAQGKKKKHCSVPPQIGRARSSQSL